jgi:hypothetical protein
MTAPSIETAIWLALKSRVQTLPADVVPQSAIAWPKVSFTPPKVRTDLAPYVIVSLLPNKAERLFIDGNAPHRRPGILQLSLMTPNANAHDFTMVTERAGQIAAHFPADLRIAAEGVTVRIERAPGIGGGYADGAYWRTPVSIYYETYA